MENSFRSLIAQSNDVSILSPRSGCVSSRKDALLAANVPGAIFFFDALDTDAKL
jgi:hypothetical protein